ncbi:MAG: HTH-type transcriptional activator RhaR [Candidatus Celerinatantimonas neptuna]|nr:MAG: HTH-type transcriptional activator RhaR [Candidatus Celerinatantimonas neptuna]
MQIMNESNEQFQYLSCPHIKGITVLKAKMQTFSYDRHAHEEYCLGVTLKGRQDFFNAGQYYRSQVGNIIIFNPEDVHDGHAGNDGSLEYKMLYIPPEKLVPMIRAISTNMTPDRLHLNHTVHHAPRLRNQILHLSMILSSPDYSQLEQETGLIQIAESMAKLAGCSPILEPSRRIDTLLLKAKEFIHHHLEQPITIDDICHEANLSKYHFIRMFKAQFGITPHQYVINCRINQAKKALEQGVQTSMAAQQTGFSDLSHLSRRFKGVFAMSPRQYQQQFTQ